MRFIRGLILGIGMFFLMIVAGFIVVGNQLDQAEFSGKETHMVFI